MLIDIPIYSIHFLVILIPSLCSRYSILYDVVGAALKTSIAICQKHKIQLFFQLKFFFFIKLLNRQKICKLLRNYKTEVLSD